MRAGAVSLLLAAAAGGCAPAPRAPSLAPAAMPEPSGDLLVDAAALLLAAEQAGDAEARAPLIARLDAMQVSAAEDAGDDPLAAWRAEHAGDPSLVYRGRALGPAYRRAQLAAGQKIRIEQVFYAGERAELVAQANSGNVALAVSDPRESAVCAKTISPRANCQWLPIYTERFSIELENRGAGTASVYIVFR